MRISKLCKVFLCLFVWGILLAACFTCWKYRYPLRESFDAILFSCDGVLDFLAICFGVNTAFSIDKVLGYFSQEIIVQWQESKNSLETCSEDFLKRISKFRKADQKNFMLASGQKELQRLQTTISWHQDFFNYVAKQVRIVFLLSSISCVLLSSISGWSAFIYFRFFLLLFLLIPVLFIFFILGYLVTSIFFISPKLKNLQKTGCQKYCDLQAMITRLKNLTAKSKQTKA